QVQGGSLGPPCHPGPLVRPAGQVRGPDHGDALVSHGMAHGVLLRATTRQLIAVNSRMTRNSAQAIAAPYPYWLKSNASRDRYRTVVRPAWRGPPVSGLVASVLPNSTCGSVKVCMLPMADMMTVNRMIGRSCGMVMRRKHCTGPAPSMRAASYS